MGKKKGGKTGGEDYWSSNFEADQLALEMAASKKNKKVAKANTTEEDDEVEEVEETTTTTTTKAPIVKDTDDDDDDEDDDDKAPAKPKQQQQPKQQQAKPSVVSTKSNKSVKEDKNALALARLALGATGAPVGTFKTKQKEVKKDAQPTDDASPAVSDADAAVLEAKRARQAAADAARAAAEAAVEREFAAQLTAFQDIDADSSDDEAPAAAAAVADEAVKAEDDDVKDAWDDSDDDDAEPAIDVAERKRREAEALAAAKAAKEERRRKRTQLRALLQQVAKQKAVEGAAAAAAVLREKKDDGADDEPINTEALRSPICCVLGHVDTGKCLARGTPVLMMDGTFKPVEHVKNGELVMGDDGTPRSVSGTTRGQQHMVQITSHEHQQPAFVCNVSHVLSLKLAGFPRRSFASAVELVVATVDASNVALRLSQRTIVCSTEQEALALCAALGADSDAMAVDGDALLQHVHKRLALSANEKVVACDETVDIAVEHFLDTRCTSAALRAAATLFHASAMQFAPQQTPLAADVHQIGMLATEQRIPHECKYGSVETRQQLLAGVAARGTELRFADEELLADVEFVARSLGLDVVRTAPLCCKLGGAARREQFTIQLVNPIADGQWRAVVDDAHKALCEAAAAREHVCVADIAPDKYVEGDYFGFQVSGNGRFVVGERCYVTHNTKLLDRIRHTNVQGGEAGGITQQIGATYFPLSTLHEQTAQLQKDGKSPDILVPGLLVIDTPGHESFTNLRSRGSSLCDMAILVVDLMHGLEQQTIESIKLLRQKKTPFVVAMNKVDRCVDWKPVDGQPIRASLKRQSRAATQQFEEHTKMIVAQFAEQEINVELYWKNKDFRKYVSLVPTSAVTGEGVPDLLLLMIQLMQKMLTVKLQQKNVLNCTVLEVKVIEGFGTTIDVVLVDGVLHEGDTIVVCGLSGAIVTTVRALLTPQPGKELRVKGTYQHHKKLRGAVGIKIAANELEGAIAGSQLLVAGPNDDIEELKEEVMGEVSSMLSQVDHSGRGVCVQASTLGSLEALLQFLRDSKIPVSGVSIGPVHRKDVMRASIMLERERELAVLLAFDVKITPDARTEADKLGVRIFEADIIYNLFDMFTAYMTAEREKRRKAASETAVFPAIVKVIKCFNKSDPVVIGCEVVEGALRLGTPLCVLGKPELELGKVTSLERDHKSVEVATVGDLVAVKIVAQSPAQSARQHGRHFNDDDQLVSLISRASIDALKEHFKDDITNEDKQLLVKLKALFKIK